MDDVIIKIGAMETGSVEHVFQTLENRIEKLKKQLGTLVHVKDFEKSLAENLKAYERFCKMKLAIARGTAVEIARLQGAESYGSRGSGGGSGGSSRGGGFPQVKFTQDHFPGTSSERQAAIAEARHQFFQKRFIKKEQVQAEGELPGASVAIRRNRSYAEHQSDLIFKRKEEETRLFSRGATTERSDVEHRKAEELRQMNQRGKLFAQYQSPDTESLSLQALIKNQKEEHALSLPINRDLISAKLSRGDEIKKIGLSQLMDEDLLKLQQQRKDTSALFSLSQPLNKQLIKAQQRNKEETQLFQLNQPLSQSLLKAQLFRANEKQLFRINHPDKDLQKAQFIAQDERKNDRFRYDINNGSYNASLERTAREAKEMRQLQAKTDNAPLDELRRKDAHNQDVKKLTMAEKTFEDGGADLHRKKATFKLHQQETLFADDEHLQKEMDFKLKKKNVLLDHSIRQQLDELKNNPNKLLEQQRLLVEKRKRTTEARGQAEMEILGMTREEAKRQRIQREHFQQFIATKAKTALLSIPGRIFGTGAAMTSAIGADFSPSGAISRATETEKRAIKLINQARGTGHRLPELGEMTTSVRDVSSKTGFDPAQIMDAMEKFQDYTGNISMGMKLIEPISKIAAAFGTNPAELTQGTGAMVAKLQKDKSLSEDQIFKMVEDVIMTVGAQGKTGAMELKDFAKEIERLSTLVSTRSGSSDFAEHMKLQGSLLQIMRLNHSSARLTTNTLKSVSDSMKKGGVTEQLEKFAERQFKDKKFAPDTVKGRLAHKYLDDNFYKENGVTKVKDMTKAIMGLGILFEGSPSKAREMHKSPGSSGPGSTKVTDLYSIFEPYFSTLGRTAKDIDQGLLDLERDFDKLSQATLGQLVTTDSLNMIQQSSSGIALKFNNEMERFANESLPEIGMTLIDLTYELQNAGLGDLFKSTATGVSSLLAILTSSDMRRLNKKDVEQSSKEQNELPQALDVESRKKREIAKAKAAENSITRLKLQKENVESDRWIQTGLAMGLVASEAFVGFKTGGVAGGAIAGPAGAATGALVGGVAGGIGGTIFHGNKLGETYDENTALQGHLDESIKKEEKRKEEALNRIKKIDDMRKNLGKLTGKPASEVTEQDFQEQLNNLFPQPNQTNQSRRRIQDYSDDEILNKLKEKADYRAGETTVNHFDKIGPPSQKEFDLFRKGETKMSRERAAEMLINHFGRIGPAPKEEADLLRKGETKVDKERVIVEFHHPPEVIEAARAFVREFVKGPPMEDISTPSIGYTRR